MAIWQASFEASETFMKKKISQTFRDPYITQTLQLWNYQRKLTISYVRPKGRSCWARRLLFQPCHSTHWLIYQSATKERYSTKLRCNSCKYTSLVFFPITRMMQLIHSVNDCQHWSTVFGRHFAANAGKSFFLYCVLLTIASVDRLHDQKHLLCGLSNSHTPIQLYMKTNQHQVPKRA